MLKRRVSLVVLAVFFLLCSSSVFAANNVGQSGQLSTAVGNFGTGGGNPNQSIDFGKVNKALACLSAKLGDLSSAVSAGSDEVEVTSLLGLVGWWRLKRESGQRLGQCVDTDVYRALEMDPNGAEAARYIKALVNGSPLKFDLGSPNADVKGKARQRLLDIVQKAKLSVDRLMGKTINPQLGSQYQGNSSYAVLSWRDRVNCLRIMTRFGVDIFEVRNVCASKPCNNGTCIVEFAGSGWAINKGVNSVFREHFGQLAPYLKKVISQGKRSVAAELLMENNPYLTGQNIVDGGSSTKDKKFNKAVKRLGKKVAPTACAAVIRELRELMKWTPDGLNHFNDEKKYSSPIVQAFAGGSQPSTNNGVGGSGGSVTTPDKPMLSFLGVDIDKPVTTNDGGFIASLFGQGTGGQACDCGCGKCTGQPGCCCCDKCQHCNKNNSCDCGCGKCTHKPNCCCCDKCQHCDKNKGGKSIDELCGQLTKLGLGPSTIEAVRRLYSSNMIAGDNITVIDQTKNTITIIGGIKAD